MEQKADHQEIVARVAQLLKKAQRVLFITGAGMSADSGLPTYRGIGGLYDDKDTDDGMPIELAISGEMLRQRPEITWKYLLQIANACHNAQHNAGHSIIAEIEKAKPNTWVFTQNIDGFHRAAGSRNMIEIHGTLDKTRCTKCAYTTTTDQVDISKLPPLCPECSSVLRHEVVLFGEQLPEHETRKLHQVYNDGFDLVLSIGTTSVFPYIAQPIMVANRQGIPTVEINPGTTEVSRMVDYRIRLGAAAALQEIWALANS